MIEITVVKLIALLVFVFSAGLGSGMIIAGIFAVHQERKLRGEDARKIPIRGIIMTNPGPPGYPPDYFSTSFLSPPVFPPLSKRGDPKI